MPLSVSFFEPAADTSRRWEITNLSPRSGSPLYRCNLIYPLASVTDAVQGRLPLLLTSIRQSGAGSQPKKSPNGTSRTGPGQRQSGPTAQGLPPRACSHPHGFKGPQARGFVGSGTFKHHSSTLSALLNPGNDGIEGSMYP